MWKPKAHDIVLSQGASKRAKGQRGTVSRTMAALLASRTRKWRRCEVEPTSNGECCVEVVIDGVMEWKWKW